MGPFRFTRNLRNAIDFYIRSHVTFQRVANPPGGVFPKDEHLRSEILTFLNSFRFWESTSFREGLPAKPIVVDIGARNFFMAPLILKFFSRLGAEPEIHGIELDAFRRYSDLHTRRDYAQFYERTIPNTHFHARDFLTFEKKIDFAFLLNPFVTEEPLMQWGLPLRTLKPSALYQHLYRLLQPTGTVLVSHPSEEELELGVKLASANGYKIAETKQWHPTASTLQQEPRLGLILTK